MKPLLKDPRLQQHFEEFGYAKLPAILGFDSMQEIAAHFRSLNIRDEFEQGYNVSMNSRDRDVRKRVQEYLNAKVFPHLAPYLVDRVPYSSTYFVKEPGGSIVWAHQDWSYCDETRYDSVMCWIPFCDVDEDNGAIGFVNGSHKYFDYVRGFPVPVAETPVVQHRLRIIPYFNLVPMKAGEAVVFNNKTIHGSFPNYTGAERIAVSMSFYPRQEPLWNYFIKPGEGVNHLLKYEVDEDFFVEYNNPRLYSLYEQGKTLEGYRLIEELPYRFEPVPWEVVRDKLTSTGNQRDAWKARKTEEFYGVKLE
jgi:ectoine hydroxylase-related dioxygenase (phytanoyl-CoA dioxygenase family)